MHTLGLEALLVDPGLQTLIQKLVEGQSQDVIEFELLIGEQTVPVHSVEQGSTFEESSRVLLLKSEQLSGCFSEAGEQKMHSPDLAFVLEAVLAYKL